MAVSQIYLDHNATTRPLPEVIETVTCHLGESFANPGSRHSFGRQARKVLESSRESLADILGAKPEEVIYTSGGTESTNLALFGFTQRSPGTIVLTKGEHPATLESCLRLVQQGWKLHYLEVDEHGRLLPEQYAGLPWPEIKLVTLILAHNETGVIQDVPPLAKLCREQGIPFHLDAVQAVGKIPVNFHELGVTSLALGAHKFYGPRGIGALLLREGTRLTPYLFGGHQEAGHRPGTEPVPLIAGMSKALEVWNQDREALTEKIRTLRDQLEVGLRETCELVIINGHPEHRLPNTLNIAFPGLEGEAILVALELEGIACSLGSTCASGSAEPAPALVAMGCPPDVYRASVRFSLGLENTPEQIPEAIQRISGVIQRLRNLEM